MNNEDMTFLDVPYNRIKHINILRNKNVKFYISQIIE